MKTANVLQTKPMQTSTNSQDQSQRGQALLEFALVLMFIILPFTFVLVDGALTLFTLANVTNAAREGAHAGSIYQTLSSSSMATIDGERSSHILNYLQTDQYGKLRNLVDVNQCSMAITYSPDPPALGNPYREMDSMTVRLACPRPLLFGLVGTGVVTLTSQATMRIEPGGTCPPDPDDPTKCDNGISP